MRDTTRKRTLGKGGARINDGGRSGGTLRYIRRCTGGRVYIAI